MTWIRLVEHIIHITRMPVDAICVALDDPKRKQQIKRLRERSRTARTLVYQS